MAEEIKDKFRRMFLEEGVYGKCQIKVENFARFSFSQHLKSLDLYCPKCKNHKTFVYDQSNGSQQMGTDKWMVDKLSWHIVSRLQYLTYACPTCDEKIYYALYFDGNNLHKIAQYPSLMDVTRDELKEFDKSKLIDESHYKEVYKAYECASSGFYVAAFTYMRRVYENLLLNLYKENKIEIAVEEGDFERLKFDQKLELLKGYLAIEESIYKPLYSILSEGIHSSPEEECQKHFTLLKIVLLDILAEQKAKKEKAEKRKAMMDLFAEKKAEVSKND